MLGAACGLDARDQRLHILYAIARRDEHRVLGLDHHMRIEAHRRDQPALAEHERIAGVLGDHIAAQHVAVGVGLDRRMERRPRADIAPTGGERHHHRIAGLLHHGVVDRVAAAGTEGLGIDPHEIEVGLGRLERRLRGRRDVRRLCRQFTQIAARAEQEHAAVPIMIPGGDEALGGAKVRLLDEAVDGVDRVRRTGARQTRKRRRRPADVAVARLGALWDHAEGHEPPRLGRRQRRPYGRLEGRPVAHHMVGGQDEQQRTRVGGIRGVARRGSRRQRHMSGQRDGRGGVTPDGLQHDPCALHARLTQLLGHHEAVGLVADHDRGRHPRQTRRAGHGRLQHGLAAPREREELLGEVLTGERPEARARTPGQDDRDDHDVESTASDAPRPMP